MRFVLGVDGGGSKTHALILEETGRAAGFGAAGGSNYDMCGMPHAEREISTAARAAISVAGLTPEQVELGYLCLAGADLAEDYALLEPHMAALGLAKRTIVRNDTMAALGAGLSRPWGIAVICGTGLNAVGRGPDGREISFPSLGPISGDWGGGNTLAEEVIRLVMRAWDGRGSPTMLSAMVLAHFGVDTEEELLHRLRHNEIAEAERMAIVPLLFDAALAGDGPARDLVIRMGGEIGISANALIRRLDLAGLDVEVVLAGSIFKANGPLLLDTVTEVIHAQAPAARISRMRYEPVVGAALLGLESMGIALTPEVIDRLDASLTPLGLHVPPV